MKEELEILGITRDRYAIVSFKTIAVYPSITLKTVKKEAKYFSRELKEEEKAKIEECLKLIEIEMGNTIQTFFDKYYKNTELKSI